MTIKKDIFDLRWVLVLLVAGCTAPTPDANPNVLNVADAAIADGHPDMALSISQSVLTQSPHDLAALYHQGAAYYALGRCEDALATYRVALQIDPHSSQAETGAGRCLLRRTPAEAQQAFAAAVADDPNNAAALSDLGIAMDLQGHFAEANAPYQKALLLAPGTAATEVNIGMSLALAGQTEDALDYLAPLANAPSATPRIRQDYALALVAAGQLDEARQFLAVDLSPDQVETVLEDYMNLTSRAPGANAQAANLFGYIPLG